MLGLPLPVIFFASLIRLGRKKGTLSASPPPATPNTKFEAPPFSFAALAAFAASFSRSRAFADSDFKALREVRAVQ